MQINRQFPLAISICVAMSVVSSRGANVLALLPTISPSHLIFDMAVIRAMAERNHNVTVFSLLPLKSEWLHPNINFIKFNTDLIDPSAAIRGLQLKGLGRFSKHLHMLNILTQQLAQALECPNMRSLTGNAGNQFDLILFGYLSGDFFFGLGEHFDCPVALLWPNIAVTSVLKLIGTPFEMSYAVSTIMNSLSPGAGFSFRLQNMLAVAAEEFTIWMYNSYSKAVYEKNFPADKYVSFEKARERVALVLFSHHFSEKPVRPLVPGLVEIGGIQLNDEPNPLPKDIDDFVSSAEHGIIFFSFGTNIKENHLQVGTLQKIYNVLSKLPQKILWKCDDEQNMLGNSSNVLFRSWFPQGDILGHPSVKLFFGHGGKGGITEAKFYGVPMVGLPIFGDQPANMEEIVQKGYGVSINNEEPLTEEIINKAVMEVLQNDSYSKTVKSFSKIYRDRPLKPKDTAVYWLEYVIRHKGAPHMQSPLRTMTLIEKTNLDVIAFLVAILIATVMVLKYFIQYSIKLLCRRRLFKAKAY